MSTIRALAIIGTFVLLTGQWATFSFPLQATQEGESSPYVNQVGKGTTAPRLIHKVEPEYTEEARDAKIRGAVVVSVEVRPDGKAHDVRVLRSLGYGLDEKAIEAVEKWRFKPGEKDGKPITVGATIEVNFQPD